MICNYNFSAFSLKNVMYEIIILQQAPFNQITYDIIGDKTAENFFSIAKDGTITLKNSINNEQEDVYFVSFLSLNWFFKIYIIYIM